MQKALQKVALFNYKLRGTLPRHDAQAQLIPWPGQHIGTSGTSSIHLFSNYTLIPCTKALFNPPLLFTIYLTHGSPFGLLQRAIGNFSYTFLLGINFIKEKFCLQIDKRNSFKFKNWNRLQFYKRNPFKNFLPSILYEKSL